MCWTNNLTSLDLSNNPALEILSCNQNRLTTLDVSSNTALTDLHCDPMNDENGNNLLETIYIAEGQSIGNLTKPNATNMVVKE